MSKDDNIAVKVHNIHKTFRIPLEGGNNLKQRIVNFAKRKKGYREFSPLNGVSFEIKKGEFFGIVGRNGSGKSTLLKTIAGIYQADEGYVKVDGKLVPFIELGVGFNPELTGRENVYLNGALLGFSRDEMTSMYEEIVDFAELRDFMDEKLKNYSSGMQVRLAFSIAIQADGDILLLDEVLAVGDSAFQRKCFEYFAQLKNDKKTVILVTHSMESMQRFCTRAALINDGKAEFVGTAREVASLYEDLNSENIKPNNEETPGVARGKDVPAELKVLLADVDGNEISSVSDRYSYIHIITTIMFKEQIENAFFGFTIRKSSGELVYWFTTEDEEVVVSTFKANRKNTFDLKIQNIFGEGDYKVAILVKSNDRAKEYLVNNDALAFSVVDRGINGWMLHPDHEWKIVRE